MVQIGQEPVIPAQAGIQLLELIARSDICGGMIYSD